MQFPTFFGINHMKELIVKKYNQDLMDIRNWWNDHDSGARTWTNVNATNSNITTLANALMSYRRPVLVYNSGTVVNIETGIDGTSGEAKILFPDGVVLSDSTAGDIQVNLTQVAAFASGTIQSGLRTGTVANNTWYLIYAVKVTKAGSTNRFVGVADTVQPTQANFATLNSNFGTNGWVYLGTIAYGDNSGTANAIVSFVQTANSTTFRSITIGNAVTGRGPRMASTASATQVIWTATSGTSINSGQIPDALRTLVIMGCVGNDGATPIFSFTDSGNNFNWTQFGLHATRPSTSIFISSSTNGVRGGAVNNEAIDIFIAGFFDSVLGVGSNPLL